MCIMFVEQYMMDIITVGPNLAGLPHMTINVGSHDGMPVGLMLIANHFEEDKMIQMSSFLEKGGKI